MYRIYVSNIGCVYDGNEWRKAIETYNDYVQQSKDNVGRAAGETVTLFEDGDVSKEYVGKLAKLES